MNFTWNQAQAAGKHIASYAAGGVTALVAFHLLSPAQGGDITTNINLITDGLTKVATGVAGLIGIATPFYTAWRAQHNASPAVQGASLASAASAAPSQNTTNAQVALLTAVATVEQKSPDLTIQGKIIVPPEVANSVPSNKVTTS